MKVGSVLLSTVCIGTLFCVAAPAIRIGNGNQQVEEKAVYITVLVSGEQFSSLLPWLVLICATVFTSVAITLLCMKCRIGKDSEISSFDKEKTAGYNFRTGSRSSFSGYPINAHCGSDNRTLDYLKTAEKPTSHELKPPTDTIQYSWRLGESRKTKQGLLAVCISPILSDSKDLELVNRVHGSARPAKLQLSKSQSPKLSNWPHSTALAKQMKTPPVYSSPGGIDNDNTSRIKALTLNRWLFAHQNSAPASAPVSEQISHLHCSQHPDQSPKTRPPSPGNDLFSSDNKTLSSHGKEALSALDKSMRLSQHKEKLQEVFKDFPANLSENQSTILDAPVSYDEYTAYTELFEKYMNKVKRNSMIADANQDLPMSFGDYMAYSELLGRFSSSKSRQGGSLGGLTNMGAQCFFGNSEDLSESLNSGQQMPKTLQNAKTSKNCPSMASLSQLTGHSLQNRNIVPLVTRGIDRAAGISYDDYTTYIDLLMDYTKKANQSGLAGDASAYNNKRSYASYAAYTELLSGYLQSLHRGFADAASGADWCISFDNYTEATGRDELEHSCSVVNEEIC